MPLFYRSTYRTHIDDLFIIHSAQATPRMTGHIRLLTRQRYMHGAMAAALHTWWQLLASSVSQPSWVHGRVIGLRVLQASSFIYSSHNRVRLLGIACSSTIAIAAWGAGLNKAFLPIFRYFKADRFSQRPSFSDLYFLFTCFHVTLLGRRRRRHCVLITKEANAADPSLLAGAADDTT